ncbi:hypothetical protein Pcinc_022073 [Petrolisthes cinctipes]|uniref:Uncharacterized protein n=1 Tax=Petrolisthes cinctipes TaxID=88211 RepID=A0AAE1FGV2_PETCI|nr:hypothetical protein Pcinc_022073 [Petrolisthes cinctipes]
MEGKGKTGKEERVRQVHKKERKRYGQSEQSERQSEAAFVPLVTIISSLEQYLPTLIFPSLVITTSPAIPTHTIQTAKFIKPASLRD